MVEANQKWLWDRLWKQKKTPSTLKNGRLNRTIKDSRAKDKLLEVKRIWKSVFLLLGKTSWHYKSKARAILSFMESVVYCQFMLIRTTCHHFFNLVSVEKYSLNDQGSSPLHCSESISVLLMVVWLTKTVLLMSSLWVKSKEEMLLKYIFLWHCFPCSSGASNAGLIMPNQGKGLFVALVALLISHIVADNEKTAKA